MSIMNSGICIWHLSARCVNSRGLPVSQFPTPYNILQSPWASDSVKHVSHLPFLEMPSKSTNSLRSNPSKSVKYVPYYSHNVQKVHANANLEAIPLMALSPADVVPFKRNQPTSALIQEATSPTARIVTLSPR
jgi:hypothetical protein